jgi:hypothetical protein
MISFITIPWERLHLKKYPLKELTPIRFLAQYAEKPSRPTQKWRDIETLSIMKQKAMNCNKK